MPSAVAVPLDRAVRALVGLGLILTVATCRDGMEPQVYLAPIAVAPVLPSDAALASFGLAIDRVRFIVLRPAPATRDAPPDTLVDTTVALPPDSTTLDIALHVPLIAAAETLQVTIVVLSGTIPLFEGTAAVEVRSGAAPAAPIEIPVQTYIGPGAGVDSVAISPAFPQLFFSDSLRFQVEAFQAGVPVTQFYVSWSTSDTNVARINGGGLLRAPASRTSVQVIARTPGGAAADSTIATFVPLPNQLLIIAGGGQTGATGQPLATQLEVEVRATDNLPVGGVDVRFRSLSGGTPADTIVTADAAGRARVTGILGATPGTQTFQASLPDFPGITAASFVATATGTVISPATSVVTVASGSVISGNPVQLRLQGKDAAGSDITTGGATVVFTRAGGSSTGSISGPADSGNGVYTAVFTGVLAGTATTIGATINGAPVTSALPTIAVSPGAISTSGSVVTVSNGTVTSGAAATLRLRGRDAAGNNVATGGDAVAFGFSGGSSTGTIGAVADSGNGAYTAAFTGVLAGTATAISASINGSAVTSPKPSVVVIPGAPAQLVLGASPGAALTGVVFSSPVQVTAHDLAGNLTPAFAGDVTIALGTNPGAGSLAGTLTQTASAGVATFNDLAIDLPSIGYTLRVTSPGLASDTTASFDVIAPAGTIFWANAAGGNWSNPANWTGGVVPGVAETAAITLPGTYTITLDVSDTIAGLQLGASSGTQTLLAASKTLHVSGTAQVNPNGLLWLKASTLAGGTLASGGRVFEEGSSTITTGITTAAGSVIRVQGNGIYGQATLTVANGFTNNGSLILTDTTSSYGATFTLTAGTLTNAAGATILADVGANGNRALNAALANQGTLTVNRQLTLNKASAAHANGGTINVLGGDLIVSQSGTSPSFTTSGAITIAGGRTIQVSGGAFGYTAGTILGPGLLTLTSVTATITPDLSTGDVPFTLTSATVNGSGTVVVATGTALVVRASAINAAVANQGFITSNGASSFNGAVSNAAGATLRAQGNGVYGASNLTFGSSWTNDGTLQLTDTTSSYGGTFTMPAGVTLTNASSGQIEAAVGAGGTRTLALALANQGTVTVSRPLTINRAGAAHSNSGTIDVSGGDLTLSQSGTSPSFTTSGTVNVPPGRTFDVNGGAVNYAAGTISGGGTLALTSTTITVAQNFSTATAGVILTSSTWGGAGTLTVSSATTLSLKASTISSALVNQGTIVGNGTSTLTGAVINDPGATLKLQGNGVYGAASLTVTTNFTNNGAILLTDTTSSYGATLNMPAGATLTNAASATIEAAVGSNGPRTLGAEVNNQGTITLNRGLTLSRAGAAHLNAGTIDVSGGDLTISQSGTSPSFSTSGTITIAPSRAVTISGGALNYTAGSISGGTLSLTNVTVAALQDFSTATAALSIASSTWGGSGILTIASGTAVYLRASTINAALVNQGSLTANGTSALNGSVTNTGLLRVQGNGTYGAGSLTIANGFTNDGAIALTDTTSSYGATLTVTAGTLLNASGGSIAALLGTNGPRNLNAQLDNRGAITVATSPNQALNISKVSADHQNRGTITLTGGDLLVSQSGTSPSFRNTGTITVAAGDTLRVSGGAFVYDSGSIGGAGALSLSGVTSAAFNLAHSIASMLIVSSTASFATPQSTGATGFQFASSTINGPGLLTNDLGRFLNVRASTIDAALDNHGTLLVNGSSSFSGALTTGDTSLIQVQGNGTYSTATMTVLNGFTNNGAIELSDIVSSYGATLNVTNGTLTNAPGSTIAALTGTNGPRTLGAALDNQGSLSVALGTNGTLTLTHAGADHLNSGTIDVSGGDLTISQSGTTPSFTNSGAINIGAGDTLRVSGGAFTHNSGTLGGGGALMLTNVVPAAFNVAHSVSAMLVSSSTVNFATPQSTGATGFSFASSTINGPGALTNDAGKSLNLRSTTVNTQLHNLGTLLANGSTNINDTLTTVPGSLLRIQGNGTFSTATVTVLKGFENSGTVELTDTTSSYGATLAVTNGKLVNLPGALINVAQGSNGPRTLAAELDNQGAIAVALAPNGTLSVNRPLSVHMNSGTIDVSGGDLTVSGTSSFTNVGAITIGGSDTLTFSGGSFTYGGGSLDGPGTLVLSGVNPANFGKPHTLGSIIMNSSTATFASNQSTASTDFLLTSSALNGPGTLTNAAGKTLNIRSSGIAAPFVNQGTLVANGSSSIDGLTTVAGSTVRVQGNGTYSTATLTVNNGMINNGAIELTDTTSSYGATLVVKTLPLVNAGTIDIQPGANGPRTIDAVIDNQGTFTGNANVTINHADAVHTNRGLYKVKTGSITFQQSGGNPSFTNQAGGSIDIDAGTVFRVTAGTVNNDLGGKISGSGTLDVRAPATFSHNGEILPGASPGKLTIAGNMQIPTTGIITIELGGPTAGTEYDQLAISGAAIFAEGTLNVVLLPTLPDPKGLSFDVMTFGPGSTTGPIRTANLPPQCVGGQVVNTGTSLRVICP